MTARDRWLVAAVLAASLAGGCASVEPGKAPPAPVSFMAALEVAIQRSSGQKLAARSWLRWTRGVKTTRPSRQSHTRATPSAAAVRR